LFLALFLLVMPAADGRAQGFNEPFSSPSLDPAWLVVPYAGPSPRAHGFLPPANDFSLTANPGHLRYVLTPMTYHEGFLTNYLNAFLFYSCCLHDAGLEIHRLLSGEHWRLDTKTTYFLPFANGRNFTVRVYFGNGGANTFYVDILRGRDVHTNHLVFNLGHKTGPNWPAVGSSDFTSLESVVAFDTGASEAPADTFFYRVERSEGVLTVEYSQDGIAWTTAYTHDLGTQLDGLAQRVVIAGHSWFVPAGSYADYDYVNLTPTVLPVDIDIKPGSDPNSVNPRTNGVTPVAILTTSAFDATSVNAGTVRFGKTGAEATATRLALEDVDNDGDMDVVFHFRTQQTGLSCGDTTATLKGQTVGGQPIEGTDSVKIVGCP